MEARRTAFIVAMVIASICIDATASDVVVKPKLLSQPAPVYTDTARKARITGDVILECTVDTNGNVTHVVVLKGLPFDLDKAAMNVAECSKYKPGTVNGEPTEMVETMTVTFKLN